MSSKTKKPQPGTYPIHAGMTEAELVELGRKARRRGSKWVILHVEDERYPEATKPIDDLKYFVGINGTVRFP